MNLNNHKLKRILLLLLLLSLLTGCWDSQDIEKRATVLAIGIDKADPDAEKQEDEISHKKENFMIPEEHMIEVNVQISIPGRIPLGPQTGGGEKSPVLVVRAVGHTIEDALLSIQQEVAKEIFLGHLRLIIMSEEAARDGLGRFNDYFRRNPEIRRTASLIISKERASKYMEIKPELERVPSIYLAEMVDNFIQIGRFPPTFIGKFWSILSSKGQDPYLPYVKIKGGKNIQINGLAYFQGEKMVGKTGPQEIGGFMGLIGEEKAGYGSFFKNPRTNQPVLLRPIDRKTRVRASLKNDKPHILLKVRYEFEIEEVEGTEPGDLNAEDIKSLEYEMQKLIGKRLKKFIKNILKTKSDIFGFGEHFRAKFPDYWNKNVKTKEKWRDIYKDLSCDVEVTANIRRKGMKAN